MKGYFEERGKAFKLEFDAAAGTFVAMPVAHGFAPVAEQTGLARKLADISSTRRQHLMKRDLQTTLATLGPEARDDLGMVNVYATLQQI